MTRDDDILRDATRRPGPVPESESPRSGRHAQRRSGTDRRAKARPHPLPMLLPVLVLLAGVGAIALMAPRAGARATKPAAAWASVAAETSASPASAPAAAPTPAFASFRGVQLLLPVPPADITVAAFHQSSYNDTYVMKPLVAIKTPAQAQPLADAARAAGSESVEPTSEPYADASGVWTGWAVQVWRTNVAGATDTALDCGARPGTPVFSPVSGTVMRIRPYKLYGRIDDFEFNIKPDGWNDVDVIVLHVTDPVVAEGDHVTAGVTRIASVRRLVGLLAGLQLRTYTSEGGDHTHVQVNRISKPNDTWIVGQDPPGLVRKSN